MGAHLRCTSCAKDMVIESYHAGRVVPCPWCRAQNDVPREIDFRTIDVAQAADETSGGTYLAVAIVGLFTGCLPVEGWVWWRTHGLITRAAEEGRPADGLLMAVRWLAGVGTVLQALGLALLLTR